MIEVTFKDLLAFSKEQDPDARVKMSENEAGNYCGCLMVQYGRAKFDIEDFHCGFATWTKLGPDGEWPHESTEASWFASLEGPILNLNLALNKSYTYKQVVDAIEKYLKKTKQ